MHMDSDIISHVNSYKGFRKTPVKTYNVLKAWIKDGSAQDRNFPWVCAGWAEGDGQRDGQNGWSR